MYACCPNLGVVSGQWMCQYRVAPACMGGLWWQEQRLHCRDSSSAGAGEGASHLHGVAAHHDACSMVCAAHRP